MFVITYIPRSINWLFNLHKYLYRIIALHMLAFLYKLILYRLILNLHRVILNRFTLHKIALNKLILDRTKLITLN